MSCWGGIVSVGAAMRSIRGVVTDGTCREAGQARELGFPVFARAQVPVTARGVRAREEQIETEVRAGVPLPQAMRDARLAGTEAP